MNRYIILWDNSLKPEDSFYQSEKFDLDIFNILKKFIEIMELSTRFTCYIYEVIVHQKSSNIPYKYRYDIIKRLTDEEINRHLLLI